MLKNKRGLSEAVMTVIMIALVLVAVGVIWVVVQNVISKQANTIDYNQKCFGIDLKPTKLTACAVTLERSSTSSGEAINGTSITISGTTTGTEYDYPGNIGTVATSTATGASCPASPASVAIRWYFLDSANVKHYCPAIAKYPAA
ncbi:Uncharacterised protein [uncultured archaeon]|nr:Uncharacterised protein [uncultured archaeon]